MKKPKLTPEEQSTTVQNWIDRWRPFLQLQGWVIDVEHKRFDPEKRECCAKTYVNTPYRNALITIYSPLWDQPTPERLVLHELGHIVTADSRDLFHTILVREKHVMWREASAVNEMEVDRITNIIWSLVKGPL